MSTNYQLNYFVVYILLIGSVLAETQQFNMKIGPHKEEIRTSCEQFSKYARFNPLSVVNKWWTIFYYWGAQPKSYYYFFRIPTAVHDAQLHAHLDGKVIVPIDWSAPRVIISNERNKSELMVELDDRGAYNFYPLDKEMKNNIFPIRLQVKQAANGRYIGLLNCAEGAAYALSASDDVPNRDEVRDAAASIGYYATKGRSYFYKGHEWMPVGDDHYM